MKTMTVSEQLDLVRQSLRASMADGMLADTSLVISDLESRIMSAIRPGIFLDKGEKLGWACLGQFDLPYFTQFPTLPEVYATGEVKGELFSDKVKRSSYLEKKVLVTLDYDSEDYTVVCVTTTEAFSVVASGARIIKPARVARQAEELPEWQVRLTLPSPFILFDSEEEGVEDWQWEYISAYEEWQFQMQEKLCIGLRPYIQVGGWPSYIQSGEDSEFIAQINCEIGDAGSVYLTTDGTLLEGFVQMF